MSFVKDNNIKGILCDIDGTLYPKSALYRRLVTSSFFHPIFALKYNKMRQRFREEDGNGDLSPLSRDEYAKRACTFMYGKCDDKTVSKFLKREKTIFHDKWERSYKSVKSYKNVKETLERAKREGIELGVLSDFPLGVKLEAMHLDGLFKAEFSSEDIGRFKPCKTPFKYAIELMGIPAENLLYVGDSERKDIAGGAEAGMFTALISKEGKDSKADIVASNWYELERALFD